MAPRATAFHSRPMDDITCRRAFAADAPCLGVLAFYPRQGYAHAGDTVYSFEGEDYSNKLFARPVGPRGDTP